MKKPLLFNYELYQTYLKDPKGNKSSTRLMAWILFQYFIVFNTILTIAIGVLIVMGIAISDGIVDSLLLYLASLETVMLSAIFVPKQIQNKYERKREIENYIPPTEE